MKLKLSATSVVVIAITAGLFWAMPVSAATLSGRVLGGGAPIANSTVTLLAASAAAPKQMAQAKTGADGRFTMTTPDGVAAGTSLYLVARGGQPTANKTSGDNPHIALLTVLGSRVPATVTINEMTTIASVWTHNQFIAGTAITDQPLQLRIAAGNVPSFVDLATGGWGTTIQDPLNSSQTPTMANFATLADALAGCVTQVKSDACSSLFAAAKGPTGAAPADTLTAAQSIAKYPWYQPGRVFALLEAFYPVPQGRTMRAVPYMPYLQWAPSAWVLPLKVTGGGYRAGGKAMFDSEGNLWVGDNFTVGWQGQDSLWQGNASKFDPNGKPLSPMTTGFAGGGMQGGTFGAAVDAKDNAWLTSYGGKTITVFDKNGKPLTPPEGLNFGGKLGLMQGVIVTPAGDVWVLGLEKSQLVFFPKGDITKGRIVCEGKSAEPCASFKLPFHLGIDQQDRIWVTNRFGNGALGLERMAKLGVVMLLGGSTDRTLAYQMFDQKGGPDGGSVSLFRPDGTAYPGSPFHGGGLPGPWAATIAGDDTVWISNFAGAVGRIAHLCGVKTENCPPGFKTGDQISPPGGYVGGGLQMQTDLAISPTGDVWVIDNWQTINSCYGDPVEALSTNCGGQGITIFFGMAKPVRAPQIGPAQPAP